MDPAAPNLAPNPKQQIVERLKGATNILVTVSVNPSVDQLAAAIGLTLMLNNMNKHATALFSGKIPEAIQFLDPQKTIENNLDLLRDFIISLDRDKASKLRYKDEGEIVRIFITPYHTKIDEHDLQFSQGEINVEVIVALGVEQREELDATIAAHGRILHDATVISMNVGANPGNLGSINWNEPVASSLCEMLMSMSEALQAGLVDTQAATALLTGIVAETQRFSNAKTTPKVMTMSAQLMAAGANQQLIANSLNGVKQLDEKPADITHGEQSTDAVSTPKEKSDEMQVNHTPVSAVQTVSTTVPPVMDTTPPVITSVPSPTMSPPALDSWASQARAEMSDDAPLPPQPMTQQAYAPNYQPMPMQPPTTPVQPLQPRFQSMPTPVVTPDATQTFPEAQRPAEPSYQTKTINPSSLPIQPPSVHGVQGGLGPRRYIGEDSPDTATSPVSSFDQNISEASSSVAEDKILSHNQPHIESLSVDTDSVSPDDPNVAIKRAREAVQHAIEEPEEEVPQSAPNAAIPTPLPARAEKAIVPEPHPYEEIPLPTPKAPIPTPLAAVPDSSTVHGPADIHQTPPDATFKIPTPVPAPSEPMITDVKAPPSAPPPPDSPPPVPL